MEQGSGISGELKNSYVGEAAFEQLLRLAALYASPTPTMKGGRGADVRRSSLVKVIELRAYQIYLGRGAAHGRDLDDWLQAERQVLEEIR
jgi:Protein of unknown function (DUF2934)